jgi:hypothetical protein
MSGFDGSAFRMMVPFWPFGTTAPFGAAISTTVTLICACGSLDRTKTVRATVDLGGTRTSSVMSCENCRKEASPPTG